MNRIPSVGESMAIYTCRDVQTVERRNRFRRNLLTVGLVTAMGAALFLDAYVGQEPERVDTKIEYNSE